MFKQWLKWAAIGWIILSLQGCEQGSAQQPYQPTAAPHHKEHYIVGIHPYLNSQKLYSAYAPILTYLEQQIPNVEFSLETSSDYASYEQKLRRGQFHFALPNPYQTIESLSSGYRVTARMAPDSVFKGLIIARKDSQIKQHEQLKQRSIAFTAKTALAATMMPKYYLYMNGVNVDKEMQPRYVTSQFSAIMNVYNKDTFVAATWPVAYKAWQREFPEAANELETLWETPSLVNNAWIARKDVPTSVTDSVTALLVHLSDTDQGKALLAPTSSDGFIAASDADYQPVREFLNAYQSSGLE